MAVLHAERSLAIADVLDGSVGIAELHLWHKIQKRVEEEYQAHRDAFSELTPEQLRAFICERCPNLTKAVSRVPVDDKEEMLELGDIAKSVPMPATVTNYDQLIPRVVCQKFRNNEPVRLTDPHGVNGKIASHRHG
jgi:hypothetical protein